MFHLGDHLILESFCIWVNKVLVVTVFFEMCFIFGFPVACQNTFATTKNVCVELISFSINRLCHLSSFASLAIAFWLFQ
jgi:hypothetical protein